MSKELIKYKETIFSKVKKFFYLYILRRKDTYKIENMDNKKQFSKRIAIIENKEEKRLRELKRLYDNKQIEEEKLTDDDIEKLIQMYDTEIEELKQDTERIKSEVSKLIAH